MRRSMTGATFLILAFSLWAGAESTDAERTVKLDGQTVQLARYAKAFIGPGNVTVEVAPYKLGDRAGAILLFHGIESDWDGQAINHAVKPADYEGETYVTLYKGADWHTVTSRKDLQGVLHYEMFVPGVREAITLVPSDGAAQLTTPKKIYDQYASQRTKETP